MRTNPPAFVLMVALAGHVAAYSQDKPNVPPSEISVEIVHIRPKVHVWVAIRNSSTNQLFIPTEGELYGVPLASFGHMRLESYGARGWGRPPHARGSALLGVSPPKGSVIIGPGASETLLVAIPIHFYEIKPRQRLRLVFIGWPNDSSFTAQSSTFQITSPEFKLP